MYLCYVDESGTPEVPGVSSHYILAALAVPIYKWRTCEQEIDKVKISYQLQNAEIHTGWLLRKYPEQSQIPDFEKLPHLQRKSEVDRIRRSEIFKLQKTSGAQSKLSQLKKNHRKTELYTHLTYEERKDFVLKIAQTIGNWGFARLFAECVDKVFFDPKRAPKPVDEQALEQIVSRFEQYLETSTSNGEASFGILIHDNNQTSAKRHTELMKEFHSRGTFWTQITNIIETPLFVDSTLTSMIQMADVCGYALRRYLENSETVLFNEIFKRAHRKGTTVVGVRHFASDTCKCSICKAHK